ncbi:hypothetical protein [Gorillibacterium massiliense]|uniref:hypothetical protein n=1 Tax=Gorillibacterium massiliense TaxID=1280390 RepID=UPI0004B04406|nr:hypothetical protein [Gorillibacterium massiliense]
MRRIRWMAAAVLSVAVILLVALQGCGNKDAGAVVGDLNKTVTKLESYKGSGRMILNTGQQPQEYQVEVWYKSPDFYRIALTSDKKDITQIVLRNDDGVFVLTPQLNKSFRFQSEWPKNQGQYYLYQSLVQSIVNDENRKLVVDGNDLVFDVEANYNNVTLPRQKIWLDKKSYKPKHVEVRDHNDNAVVVVDFTDFTFGAKFEKDSFDMQRNMTGMGSVDPKTEDLADSAGSADSREADSNDQSQTGTDSSDNTKPKGNAKPSLQPSVQPTVQPTENQSPNVQPTESPSVMPTMTAAPSGKANTGKKNTATVSPTVSAATASPTPTPTPSKGTKKSSAGVDGTTANTTSEVVVGEQGLTVPAITLPEGVEQADVNQVTIGEDAAVLVRYKGTYNFSLVMSRPNAMQVNITPGTMVNLGFTIGSLTGTDNKTLTWVDNGYQFRLTSSDLPLEEMVAISQSLEEDGGK